MPLRIVLGKKRTIKGEDHVSVLLFIKKKDEKGRPLEVEVCFSGTHRALPGNEEAVTAWLSGKLLRVGQPPEPEAT